ncbi:MAG TPA: hypothetical protein VI564_06375 [Candidatus Nanoarchaeia archaeon]|nr:hypothetical protein [Candidatus Nanoarchaeia archaeon]
MTQCREHGCSEEATREWNGRKVCQDHYDKYRDHHDTLGNDIS